jgi:hypothetical protein
MLSHLDRSLMVMSRSLDSQLQWAYYIMEAKSGEAWGLAHCEFIWKISDWALFKLGENYGDRKLVLSE